MEHKEHFHGSDLEKIEKVYGIKKENITSFSANVNPLGLSGKLKDTLSEHLDVLTSYPDREYSELRSTIAKYCDTVKENVVVGNGSTELISLFTKVIAPKKALVFAPTYSEYDHEISLSGGDFDYFELKEEDGYAPDLDALKLVLKKNYDLVVICNPDNPTSYLIDKKMMEQILIMCPAPTYVMVDETYMEFAPDYESSNGISLTERFDHLFIIRGISKFFAAPGLRLGYAVTGNHTLIEQMVAEQNPWSINSLAEMAGKLMFTDHDYISRTKRLIFSERERICARLDTIKGLKYYKPSANFVLVKILNPDVDADILFDVCIRKNMMIRNCSSFPYLSNRYFRFCIMSPGMNELLLKCIEEVVGK